jgi:hypothetical protein
LIDAVIADVASTDGAQWVYRINPSNVPAPH